MSVYISDINVTSYIKLKPNDIVNDILPILKGKFNVINNIFNVLYTFIFLII